MGDKITLYHYTTPEGQVGILDSGVIKESQGFGTHDDAAFGDGVYMTSLPPSEGQFGLAINNYDGSKDNAVDAIIDGRVDSYIEVELNKEDVEKVEDPGNPDRDIYLYQGDLDLDDAIGVSYGDVEHIH